MFLFFFFPKENLVANPSDLLHICGWISCKPVGIDWWAYSMFYLNTKLLKFVAAFNLEFYTDVQDLSYLQEYLDQDPRSAKYRCEASISGNIYPFCIAMKYHSL